MEISVRNFYTVFDPNGKMSREKLFELIDKE